MSRVWLGTVAVVMLAAPPSARADNVTILHRPASCVPGDRYLEVGATGLPADRVRGAELQFRLGPDAPWYSAAMRRLGHDWWGVLPRPTPSVRRFEYRIVMTAGALAPGVTTAFAVRVEAEGSTTCDATAHSSLDAPIAVRVPPGAPLVPPVPPGFSPAGVVTAQEREPTRSSKLPLFAGAAGLAGGAAALAATRGSEAAAPLEPDIPEFSFSRTLPGPGALLSLSHTQLVVFVSMSYVPARPLDLVWRLELRPAGDVAVCLVMQGLFNRAREPVSLALLAPLSATGACGERFEVALGHLTIETLGQPVLDATLELPFSVEP